VAGPDALTGRVVRPGEPGYEEARLDYNLHFADVRPRYIVFCTAPEDVGNAIRFARTRGLPLRARSGRHSYEAYSIVDGGVVIDVSPLCGVRLDPDRRLCRIGAGADLGRIYEALWAQGRRAIAGGTCGGVGIAGLTLGGGFGLIGRRYGLTCDRLVGLEMYDARGRRVAADDRSRPNLMWASRGGGGGNFGIVTSLTFRVVPVGRVSIFRLLWPWEAIVDAIGAFEDWGDPDRLDWRLTPVLNLKARQAGNVAVFGQFLGPVWQLRNLVRPLARAIRPIETEFAALTFIEAVRHFGGAVPGAERWAIEPSERGERFKNSSAYQYRRFPRQAAEILRDHLAQTPGPACLVQEDLYGGQVAAVSDAATAVAHRRRVRAVLQPQAYWDRASEANAHIAWVGSLRRALAPYTDGGYVNYIDRDVRDWPRFYYGQNLPRLIRVKRHYDPENVFDFPQGLSRLTGPEAPPDTVDAGTGA
jgi:FAD/FMN-containing dehydrogenase